MSNLFRQFTAEATRDLLGRLDLSHSSLSQNSCVPQWHRSLNLVDAEAGDHLALFPESDWSSTSDWCVFICEGADGSRETDTYLLTSRLPDSGANDEFVAASHSVLLARPIAPEGEAILARLLDSGQMARRDLLRMLARSSEAQALGRRVLIIPSPSSWLPEIGATRPGETVFSVRVTR